MVLIKEKRNEDKIPEVEKDGWKAEELAEDASNEDPDDIVEKLNRDKDNSGEEGGCCGR